MVDSIEHFGFHQFGGFFHRAKGDFFYGFLLLLSAFFAFLLRAKSNANLYRILDGFLGLTIAVFVAGRLLFCSLLLVAAHLFLYRFVRCPRSLATFSFYGTFAFLASLRLMHFVGMPRLEFVTNAIQLILTLRVIGLSYEISDFRLAKKNDSDGNREGNKVLGLEREPTLFEAFNYLFCFIGLFTGPYFTYRTYSDAITRWEHCPLEFKKLQPLLAIKVRTLCWSLPSLIFLTWIDPVNAIRGDRLHSIGGILHTFFRVALAFVYLRMRIYSAWMVAESICILAGIGLYPRETKSKPGNGPTELSKISENTWLSSETEFDSEAINNLDIPSVEHSDGFRSGIRAWNRTVQFWLANFVYQRSSKAIRMPYTMLVSAFWHGVHPGYFLSFLTIPLCTAAEDKLFRAFPTEKRPKYLQYFWSFIRMRGFEFMASGFLLLDGWDTLKLWAKMYFWLHLAMLFTIVAVWIFDKDKHNDEDNADKRKKQRLVGGAQTRDRPFSSNANDEK